MGNAADPDWQAIWECPQRNKCLEKDLHPETRVGVYALFLNDSEALAGLHVDPAGPLYVGMTDSGLKFRNHFTHKHSGFSTPRRSLGAILKQELGLKAEPRAPGASTNVECYRFSGTGEERLTSWMKAHLECACVAVEHGIADLERQLVKNLQPPLNLNGWKNPNRSWLQKLRRDCRDEANRARQA